MSKALRYLEDKQRQHFDKHGVYAGNSLIAKWMEDYHQERSMHDALNGAVYELKSQEAEEQDIIRKLWRDIIVSIASKNSDLTKSHFKAARKAINEYKSIFKIGDYKSYEKEKADGERRDREQLDRLRNAVRFRGEFTDPSG